MKLLHLHQSQNHAESLKKEVHVGCMNLPPRQDAESRDLGKALLRDYEHDTIYKTTFRAYLSDGPYSTLVLFRESDWLQGLLLI